MVDTQYYSHEEECLLTQQISSELASDSFISLSNLITPYAVGIIVRNFPDEILSNLKRLQEEWGELFIRWQLVTAFLRGWRASEAGDRFASAESELNSEIEFLVSQNSTTIGITFASRINDYFCDAVWLFAKTADPSARLAAHCAGAVAQDEQRDSLILYLEALSNDWLERTPEISSVSDRLEDLADELNSRDWTLEDSIELKTKLSKANLEYLIALGGSDPTVFRHRFPDIFHDYDLIYGER